MLRVFESTLNNLTGALLKGRVSALHGIQSSTLGAFRGLKGAQKSFVQNRPKVLMEAPGGGFTLANPGAIKRMSQTFSRQFSKLNAKATEFVSVKTTEVVEKTTKVFTKPNKGKGKQKDTEGEKIPFLKKVKNFFRDIYLRSDVLIKGPLIRMGNTEEVLLNPGPKIDLEVSQVPLIWKLRTVFVAFGHRVSAWWSS